MAIRDDEETPSIRRDMGYIYECVVRGELLEREVRRVLRHHVGRRPVRDNPTAHLERQDPRS